MDKYYSVIIPFHGKKESLEIVLSSLESANYSKKETILVNDGSGYDLSSIVEKFHCSLINLSQRKGPSFARNLGAKEAKFKNLIFLDSDIIVPDDCFVKINDFLDNKSVSVVNCLVSTNIPCDGFFSQYENILFRYDILKGARDTVYTFFCVVKIDCFWKVGGFDERVPLPYADDVILGWKLRNIGCKFGLIEEIEVQHYKRMTLLKFISYRFLHAYYWGKYFIIYRRLLKSLKAFNKKEGFLTVATIFIFFGLIYFKLFNLSTTIFIFLGLFMGVNFNFLRSILRNKGFLFTIKSIWITIFQYIIYSIGAIIGMISGFLQEAKSKFLKILRHEIGRTN